MKLVLFAKSISRNLGDDYHGVGGDWHVGDERVVDEKSAQYLCESFDRSFVTLEHAEKQELPSTGSVVSDVMIASISSVPDNAGVVAVDVKSDRVETANVMINPDKLKAGWRRLAGKKSKE